MLRAFLQNVVMFNVVMLIVVAPLMIDLSANQSTHGGAKASFTHTFFAAFSTCVLTAFYAKSNFCG
jgi:hypothetical protein